MRWCEGWRQGEGRRILAMTCISFFLLWLNSIGHTIDLFMDYPIGDVATSGDTAANNSDDLRYI